MKTAVVFVLLSAGLEAVWAEVKYFELGGKLSLLPESVPKEGITAVIWKHEGDFVAEWARNGVNLTYFGDFKTRTDLNTITGELSIRSMTQADEGVFSVEVNQKAQTLLYSAQGIRHLRDRKVEAVVRPLSCTSSSPGCTLSCRVDETGVGPVQYFWQLDEGLWEESQRDRNINNDEKTQLINTFSCKISNPISTKESEPLRNPFKPEQQSNGALVGGIIFLVILIVAGIGISVLAYKHPEKVVPCLPCVVGHDEHQGHGEKVRESGSAEADTGTSNKTSPDHDKDYESILLNGPETGTSNKTSPDHDKDCESILLNGPETGTSNKTSPDHDKDCESIPLNGPETGTSNGTPSNT